MIAFNFTTPVEMETKYAPPDIGALEYACHLMAQAAGLIVPEAHLFKSKHGSGYFGVKRFDHQGSVNYHMHTIDKVRAATTKWPIFADMARATTASTAAIQCY